jgi:hypothetical protein
VPSLIAPWQAEVPLAPSRAFLLILGLFEPSQTFVIERVFRDYGDNNKKNYT